MPCRGELGVTVKGSLHEAPGSVGPPGATAHRPCLPLMRDMLPLAWLPCFRGMARCVIIKCTSERYPQSLRNGGSRAVCWTRRPLPGHRTALHLCHSLRPGSQVTKQSPCGLRAPGWHPEEAREPGSLCMATRRASASTRRPRPHADGLCSCPGWVGSDLTCHFLKGLTVMTSQIALRVGTALF